MWARRAPLGLLFLFLLICRSRARLVNISIDDTYGDVTTGQKPVYQPSSTGYWYHLTNCTGTSGCSTAPNTSLAFDGTWSAGSYDPLSSSFNVTGINITLSFTGISIWIFFILPNIRGSGANLDSFNTVCNFTLDGYYMGSFFHPANVSTVQFNATVFNATGLSNSPHELVISTKWMYQTYVIFDYAIYTADTPDNTTSSALIGSSSTKTIVHSSSTQTAGTHFSSSNTKLRITIGCALGGLGLVALLVALVFRYRRSRKKEKGVIGPIPGPVAGNPNDVTTDNIHNENFRTSEAALPNQHDVIHSHLFDATSRLARLVPSRRFQSAQVPKGQDELRAVRQMEINQRLQTAQQEMQNLTSRQSAIRSETRYVSSLSDVRRQETEHEMEIMREQIRHLNTRIEDLHIQLSSDWAQGLSNEPDTDDISSTSTIQRIRRETTSSWKLPSITETYWGQVGQYYHGVPEL